MTRQEFYEAHDITQADFERPEVTREERTEAQALYTAIMTDTLIEEE